MEDWMRGLLCQAAAEPDDHSGLRAGGRQDQKGYVPGQQQPQEC